MSEILLLDRMVLNSADYREDYLDGRLHLVVPAVAIAEGVWEGSEGPIMYEADDLRAADPVWNHRPIVLGHPKKKGKPVSAADPEILNKYGLGIMLNTRTGEDGKQRYEAWIDVDKANKVDVRVVRNIRRKTKVETSTGLYADLKKGDGDWNGKPYKYTAKEHKPDHMAVLLDEVGAYSVADGGGLLANSATMPEDVRHFLQNTVTAWLAQRRLTTNGSVENIKAQLYRKLAATYGEPGKEWYGHVEAMFDNVVVFSTGGPDWSCMKVGFKETKDGVELIGEAEPVKSVHGYRSADGSVLMVNGSADLLTGDDDMTAKEHAAALVANGQFAESDRAWLEGLGEGVLKIKVVAKPEGKKPDPILNAAPTTPPAAVQQGTVLTPEMALVLNEFLQEKQVKKERLIGNILANPNNRFTEEWLKAQPYPVLEGIAGFAGTTATAQPSAEGLTGSTQWILQNAGNRQKQQEELPTLDTSGIDDVFAAKK